MARAAPLVTFDAKRKKFTIDGFEPPSVTKAIFCLQEFARIPASVIQAAADRGTQVHRITEALDRGKTTPEAAYDLAAQTGVQGYIASYVEWKARTHVAILNIEEAVCHPIYRYQGTYDRLVRLNDNLGVLDLKTVSVMGPHIGVQLAAYQEAVNYSRGAPRFTHRWGLQLKEDGSQARIYTYDDRGDFGTFLATLTLFNWREKHGIDTPDAPET